MRLLLIAIVLMRMLLMVLIVLLGALLIAIVLTRVLLLVIVLVRMQLMVTMVMVRTKRLKSCSDQDNCNNNHMSPSFLLTRVPPRFK